MEGKPSETKAFLDIERFYTDDAELDILLLWLEEHRRDWPDIMITIKAKQFMS